MKNKLSLILILGIFSIMWLSLSGCMQNRDVAEVTPEPENQVLTVYSGRNEKLVGSVIEQFEKATGIDVQVKYGSTAQLASLILEEGDKSPADVYFAQDAGALGALSQNDRLIELPTLVRKQVAPVYQSPKGHWVGITGRSRTVVYNKSDVKPEDLPTDIFGYCDEQWKGKIGWAPTNGSFQSFVTALRMLEGEEKAEQWLNCIKENGAIIYPKNTPIVQAAADGDILVGFVNHYYLHRFLAEKGDDFNAANHFMTAGDAGSLVNIAGVGILKSSDKQELAEQFVTYLLDNEAQEYFAQKTYEYPLNDEVSPVDKLPQLEKLSTPDLDLSKLEDLEGTLDLLKKLELLS